MPIQRASFPDRLISAMANGEIKELLIDSRSLADPTATLFFALPSQGNDGHRYVRSLYEKGVRNFVVNHLPDDMNGAADASLYVVPDTRQALQSIGAELRRRTDAEVVAITGSHGKTVLKEWIFQLLEPCIKIARSPRSYNSQIGVPLSLWQMYAARPELAIIEAGISRKGEMERLAAMIAPDVVIVTGIGTEHADGFDSLQNKVDEKLALATGDNVKALIYNGDDKPLAEGVRRLAERGPHPELLQWSLKNTHAPLYIRAEQTPDGNATLLHYVYNPTGATGTVTIPFIAAADVENACSALAFLIYKGYAEICAPNFPTLHHIATRLNVSEGVNNCSIIYDNYTSDVSSLAPAIDFMRRRTPEEMPTTLILSDPRHETTDPDAACRRIAKIVDEMGVDRFIGVGPLLCAHRDLFSTASLFFGTTDELMDRLSTSDFDSEAILLKGAPQFRFEKILQRLEARTHETVLEVNLDAIVKNFNYFRSHLPLGTGLIAMVKASGYGAGSYEIARTMQEHGASYLAVAVIDEGVELRRRGIHMPIMVMNPKVVNYKTMFAHRLEPEIYSPAMLDDVIREARKNGIENYPVHIKLDTGMHRMGFIEEEIPALMATLASQNNVAAASVFTHLATADCPDMDEYTLRQLRLFDRLTNEMLAKSPRPFLRHVLNSAGILRFPEYHYDMARLGIGLYGVNTLPEEMEQPLATVSTLRTVIIAIREWEAGESIGYGRKGILTRRSRIATIPIGYADGMNRHFGRGNVSVLVNGKPAPTIGNICMDACMIDVTGIDCREGDEVEIFGPNADVQRLADTLDTIPYEILTSVSPRVKRVYYRE